MTGMRAWIMLSVSEDDPLENSFAYLFSSRERAVAFAERRIRARGLAVEWSGEATEDGGIMCLYFHDETGGPSVYEVWCTKVDDDEYA